MPRRDSRIPDSSSTMRMCAMVSVVGRWSFVVGVMPITLREVAGTEQRLTTSCLARGRRADSLHRDRQFNHKAAAERLVFFHANRTVMVFDDPAYNRQPQPGAAAFG